MLELFDMEQFLTNEEYRKIWINLNESLKSGFNILEILSLTPNFFNMSTLYPIVNKLLNSVSNTYNNCINIANTLSNEKEYKYKVNDNFKAITDVINDTRIYNFIRTSNITLDLNELCKLTGTQILL